MRITAQFFLAFAISLVLVPICRALARKTGFVAQPKEDRWHQRPTALFGGVAIGATLFANLGTIAGAGQVRVLLACAAAIFVLGLADDAKSLRPSTKLVGQIVVASVFLSFGYRLNWLTSQTLDSLLTIVWVVGITNAFNLLDNMDGLCAGTALIVGGSFLVGLVPAIQDPLPYAQAQYLAILLGATGGFLLYNLPPATIFMGDSGSLLIGLSFAGLTLGTIPGAAGKSRLLSIVAGPALVFLIPIFDTSLVTISRVLSGRSATVGGRDHSSHRLVAIGLSEAAAVRVLWLLAAMGGMLGVAVQRIGDGWTALAAAVFVLAMMIFAVYLARVRVYDGADRIALSRGKITPLVADFMYKRRVAEVLLDVCLIAIAYYTAYRLRFETNVQFGANFDRFLKTLPIVLSVQMFGLFAVGAYRGVWRYFGLVDAVVIAKGILMVTFAAELAIFTFGRLAAYSRTVFIIYGVLLLLLLTLSRASFRLLDEFIRRRRAIGQRLIIYGAGGGGALVIRDLMQDERRAFQVLGFIDDDASKARSRVQGYPVLGGYQSLSSLIMAGAVDLVVISARLITVERLRELQALCSEYGVALSRLNVGFEPLVGTSEPISLPRVKMGSGGAAF